MFFVRNLCILWRVVIVAAGRSFCTWRSHVSLSFSMICLRKRCVTNSSTRWKRRKRSHSTWKQEFSFLWKSRHANIFLSRCLVTQVSKQETEISFFHERWITHISFFCRSSLTSFSSKEIERRKTYLSLLHIFLCLLSRVFVQRKSISTGCFLPPHRHLFLFLFETTWNIFLSPGRNSPGIHEKQRTHLPLFKKSTIPLHSSHQMAIFSIQPKKSTYT